MEGGKKKKSVAEIYLRLLFYFIFGIFAIIIFEFWTHLQINLAIMF